MRIAALISWIATAGFGLTMVSIWLELGGRRTPFLRVLTSRRIVVHVLPAVLGLGSWIVFVAHGPKPFGWIALALLAPVGVIGFWNFFLWQKRRLGVLRATPRSWDLPPRLAGNEQIPAEQHFPVASVFLHGVLAVVTIGLVLLANLGVGPGEGKAAPRHEVVDRTPPLVGLRLPPVQRASRNGGVVASVVCDERCSVGLSARFTAAGSLPVIYTREIARAGELLRLRDGLTFPVRRELARGRAVAVRAAVRACDGAGNCTPLMRRRVRLLR
jgi:manganese efflux pump family protein